MIRDKSVLITGAGRGIGKRLAMGFAQAGARVGLLSRSQAELARGWLDDSTSDFLSKADASMVIPRHSDDPLDGAVRDERRFLSTARPA